MNATIKWTGAIVLSLLAHAGAATLFEPEDKPTELAMIEGGEAMEVAVLGNAFDETLQAGDPTETVEPLETPPEDVEPEPVETAAVTPVQPEVAAETPMDIVPSEADVILPADEIPPVAAVEPEVTASVAPVEEIVPEEPPEEKPELEKVVKPEPEKPEPEKKVEPKKKPERKKPVKKVAGETGNAQASQKKGQADGVEGAKSSSTQGKKGAFSRQSGNANMSNYDGKVRSKLNRSFRYPPKAKREGLQGVAQVRFTVSSSGAASNISIARSAGSAILDQAALDTVRRASPFPKIPDGAGINSKTYTIPLQFNR